MIALVEERHARAGIAPLLATLGMVPSHSRPHVSDDNPFTEAQFKPLKCRPDFPARFGAYEDAETFCRRFFPWYNVEHRHGALGLMTGRGQVAPAGRRPAHGLCRRPGALPPWGAGPPAAADGRVDQQAPSTGAGARRARPGRLMTATH